jgi:hypothetical protein
MATDLRVDADFPGGNIVVEEIAGDTIRVHQDLRDTTGWWFYWAFRLHGGAGRTIRVQFTREDVLGALGPAVSPDGEQWQWLGQAACADGGFSYAVPPGQETVWFAFCPLYTTRQLAAFLAGQPALVRHTLCVSEGGRPVPYLELPATAAPPRQHVLLTARHHACEAMANFVLEGVLAFATSAEPAAQALRRQTTLHALPFMDLDGVERGDQGKSRAPHDHNRDYLPEPRYASVRTLLAQAPTWPGRPALMLDLHCPWIRGGRNEELFTVGPAAASPAAVARFHQALGAVQRGPLRCLAAHHLPFGEEWNTTVSGTAAGHFARRYGLGMTLEVPYARAGGVPVTPASARQFGTDLGRALAAFLG